MKHILLLTDFSENSWNALFMAVKLFAPWRCKFYILHTFEPKDWQIGGDDAGDMEVITPEQQEPMDKLNGITDYLRKNHGNPNHTFSTLLMAGDLVDTVHALVPKYDLDLIVLGTHGKTGAKTVFAGNNARKVLRKQIHCNLLLVPGSYNFQKLHHVIYHTDFTHFTPKYILMPLLELLEQWKSKVHIVHVALEFSLTEQQNINKSVLEKRFKGLELSFDQVDLTKSVAWDILKKANDLKSDMIVTTKYNHSIFEVLLHESVLKKLRSSTKVPIWVNPDLQP